MQIKPVKKCFYHTPVYPSRKEVVLNRLLLENRPRRWQKTPIVAAALSATVLLGLTGCADLEIALGLRTAGVPLPPQMMITEDETYMVISSEFKNIGYDVEKDDGLIVDVQLPVKLYNEKKDKRTKKVPVQLDFKLRDKNVKMEFVSKEDMLSIYSQEDMGSYWLANKLKKALKKSDPDTIYKTFYDSGTSDEDNARALEELRQQVKDFIEWLQAEGVI